MTAERIEMDDANITKFAGMLSALSQATRLRIVAVVASGPSGGTPAGQIARTVHCPASTLSFHLKELTQAGLLRAEPEGRFIRYSVAPAAFQELAEFVRKLPVSRRTEPPAQAAPRRRRGGKRAARSAAAKGEGQLSIFDE